MLIQGIPDFFQVNYLDTDKLHCMALLVSRRGHVLLEDYRGTGELGGGNAIGMDTLFRIYSMTKPVTAAAAMMLYEDGAIRLDDPVEKFIPEFAHTRVWTGGTASAYETRKADRPMQIRDLLTHTSGLTYGHLPMHEVDSLYRREGIELIQPSETLESMCTRLARLPLLFSPGTRWNYGHSTDVLGRVIEVATGMMLDVAMKTLIFDPLGMQDTGFHLAPNNAARLPACYTKNVVTREVALSSDAGVWCSISPTVMLSGGAGLFSTLRDYHRFCLMLLDGGKVDGQRLISPKTVDQMLQNQLPRNQTMRQFGDRVFSEAGLQGHGFSFAGSVVVDHAQTRLPASPGTFSWGGLANTYFWIDPAKELVAIQATQMIPSGYYPIQAQFQKMVYATLT